MVMFIPKKGLSATEHESIDHSEIPGCGEEAFDEAAHALVDHSTQLGVPSISGLLDESAHDDLDHAGLTGVPNIEGLLDESAHDALDHAGLTGVPSEFNWDLDAATPHRLVDHSGIPGIATEEVFDEAAHALTDHSSQLGVPSVAGLLDETAHDALDHTGLTGVGGGSDYFVDPVAAEANLPSSDNNDGDLIVVKDSHKIYIWDAEASTPCWRETNRIITHENVTVDASSWRNFQISLIDRSMLNILDFECIISKIAITAIDGNATPAMDYNIELFTDSSRTVYAYWAQNIDTVLFEDKIPFLWEGGSTVYGRIVNNAASAITDLDITIKYRV